MKLTILNIAGHRNGISGAPFTAIIFRDDGEQAGVKIGIVFDAPGHTAVLDVAKLADFDVEFGSNSWRGDQYEPLLRTAIEQGTVTEAASTDGVESGIGRLLAEQHEIAIVWSTQDVLMVRPDLNESQAWDALLFAHRQHDASCGMNWDSLEYAAETLFGPMPESESSEEVSDGK